MKSRGTGLLDALGVKQGSVVSLAGAGGKTSLLFALAAEAAERWGPEGILATTTTRMLEPGREDFPQGLRAAGSPSGTSVESRLALAETLDDALQVVRAKLAGGAADRPSGLPEQPRAGLLVLGTRFVGELGGCGESGRGGEPGGRRKFAGLPPGWVDEIARRFPGLVVLVEADGAAGKPLKAPAGHEPVIPSSSTVVVAVAGLDALGMPLDPTHVHRPERLAELTGHALGSPATSDVIATALWHPDGCGKGSPPGAVLVPVINKVDSMEALAAAREVAGKLTGRGAPRVLLTSCRRWPVVMEVVEDTRRSDVAAIVLAAGASTRMGTSKQLLMWEGEPLIVRTLRRVLAARVGPVIVVLGHGADEIRPLLEPLGGEAGDRLRVVVNPGHRTGGQSSSVSVGLTALATIDHERIRAVVFVNCDQPLLRADHIDALVDRFEGVQASVGRLLSDPDRAIVVPVHDGRHGHPVLFGRAFFGELADVKGDEGGRSVIRRHSEAVVEVPADQAVVADVDTRQDLEDLETNLKRDRS